MTQLQAFLEHSARRYPDKTALVCGPARRTWQSIDREANGLARTLSGAGLQAGDRVVIHLDNGLEAAVAIFAVLKAGGAFVVIHPTTKAGKLATVLADSGAAMLVTDAKKLTATLPTLDGLLDLASVYVVDLDLEVDRITSSLRTWLARTCKRRGAVVALSGGIDSSVVGALCVEALGATRVLGLLLPERESSETTRTLGRQVADHLGIRTEEQDITPVLESTGCYRLRDEAIREVVPEYGAKHKCKIVLPGLLGDDRLRLFSVVVLGPDGHASTTRLPHAAYLAVVAASNFKQRVRKMLEYHWADRMNYAVAGTPNRVEYDQGFFVKGGDGLADAKPVAHLYKTQVYQLAKHLGIPEAIRRQPPTTDTYPLEQTQEEFYFSLPYEQMDLCLFAHNHGIAPEQVAADLGLDVQGVERVFRDIEQKRRTTRYLHLAPHLVEPVSEVHG